MIEQIALGIVALLGLTWGIGFLYYFCQMITHLWPKRHKYLTSKYHPAVQGGFVIAVCLYYSLFWPKTTWDAAHSL